MRRPASGIWRDHSGAVAPTVALSLVGLLVVGGVAFDYAHLAAMDTELQQAADQAALAAATQLDGQSGAIARATAAAQNLITNRTLLAGGTGSNAVTVPTITFCSAFDDSVANTATACTTTTSDSAAKVVWVTVGGRTANYTLTPIIGLFSSGSIAAEGVATLNSALCKQPPVMMCNPEETSSSASFNTSSYIGKGLELTSVGNGSGAWAPGDFGYLDTNISTVNGQENQLRAALGWNNPPGTCVALTGVSTKPGANVSVTDSLNTRFDIYDSNVSCLNGGACSASINSVKDVRRPADANNTGNGCKIHNQGWQLDTSGTGYYGQTVPSSATALPTTTTPSAMGHPRDICHAVSANGSCAGGRVGDGNWDRDAYFRTNYVRSVAGAGGAAGTAWSSADWQANTGLSPSVATTATNYASRYNVYSWEIAHRGQVIDGVTILGARDPAATGNTLVSYGTPQCSASQGYGAGQIPNATTPDRRRISVAVVNCLANGVNGSSTNVPVAKWLDVFLVEPSVNRARTSQGDVYVEVINESKVGGGAGAPAGSVVRHDVPVLIR